MQLFHFSVDTLFMKLKSVNKGKSLARQKTTLCSAMGLQEDLDKRDGFCSCLGQKPPLSPGAHGFHRRVCNFSVGSKITFGLSHISFILIFIFRWLEENITNQHFSVVSSGSKGCGKSKEQGAHGLRKDC